MRTGLSPPTTCEEEPSPQPSAPVVTGSRRTIARNTIWMCAGQGGRAVVQAIYFVLIARALGAANYGAFLGVVALVGVAAPFATLGAGNLLIKNVARDRSTFARYWGNGLVVSVLSSTVLIVVVLAAGRVFLPRSVGLILLLLVALGDVLFARLVDLAGQAYQAVDRLNKTALILVMSSVFRLGAAGFLYTFVHNASATDWAFLYMASSLVCAAMSLGLIHREFEPPSVDLSRVFADLREGWYFSASLSAQTLYNDIDKTMLASIAGAASTGIYGAAYRIIDTGFTPIKSLLFSTYTRFFQHGSSGIRASANFARHLLPATLGYATLMSAGIFVAAPLIPQLLGADFGRSVSAARWLALLPVLKAAHYLAADTLTGAGYQRARTCAQGGVAAFNVIINLWLISAYSWRGAAWASLASDGLLMVLLWTMLAHFLRREDRERLEVRS